MVDILGCSNAGLEGAASTSPVGVATLRSIDFQYFNVVTSNKSPERRCHDQAPRLFEPWPSFRYRLDAAKVAATTCSSTMNMNRTLLGLACLLCSTLAGASDWTPYKSKGVTHVEYRHEGDRLLHVRAETIAHATVDAFLHLLEDTDNISKWAANTYRAELLEQSEPRTHVVHTYFDASWPVSRRDMVTRSVWQQHSDGHFVMTVTDVGQSHPLADGHVRMKRIRASWTLTPQSGGKLLIRYEGSADPGGKLPQLISDKVALRSTLQTFQALPEALQHYQRPYPGLIR